MPLTDAELDLQITQAARQATREKAELMAESAAVKWLKEWDETHWLRYPNQDPRKSVTAEALRTMTLEQWDTIVVLAKRFPTVAHNAKWHFGFGMTIYSFPPTQWVNEVERICVVNTDHFPSQLARKVLADTDYDLEKDPDLRASREWGWTLFSPVTHMEQKTAWAKMFKLAAPAPKSAYDY